MNDITVYIDAIGLCGPGLTHWKAAQDLLKTEDSFVFSSPIIPPSEYLPAAERRRVGTAVKLALAAATDALASSPYKACDLVSVFSSSGGDGDNCHSICEALASQDRLISPTKFTNSVHNAPSGYWGIALHAKPASTSLCAFDGSFSAGFLEACTLAITARQPVLLVAYDTPYPEPLRSVRPIDASFGVALVISPQLSAATLSNVRIKLGKGTLSTMKHSELESLRRNVPAARCLPLLQSIACAHQNKPLALELFENQQLLLEVGV
jgi:Beta-ketoacyl synthase, N-terminal domain